MLKHALIRASGTSSPSPILTLEKNPELGLNFSLINLGPGEIYNYRSGYESALVLLNGQVIFNDSIRAERFSLFEQNPSVAHSPKDTPINIQAVCLSELALIEVANQASFAPQIFGSEHLLDNEHRGRGLWDNAAYRMVRTVFDGRNRPQANLVLGEVVNFPGRWSSFPPHHHPQPEFYHYRFSHNAGYGHGEMGDEVYKIRHGDTLVIESGHTHAQVAAPAYAMYYLWVIRQSPSMPYTTPIFAPEHAWLLEPGV